MIVLLFDIVLIFRTVNYSVKISFPSKVTRFDLRVEEKIWSPLLDNIIIAHINCQPVLSRSGN